MILPYIEINQPIGTFYLTKMKASDLIAKTDVNHRIDTLSGIQRELSERRANEISRFCDDPDAVFPTAIIVSVYDPSIFLSVDDRYFEIPDTVEKIGEVIDGQHRRAGIMKNASFSEYDLPVVLLFDLDPEDKAYVFSIINSKQTQVNSSLLFDLFEFSSLRTPQKFVHELARSFNDTPASPLYGRVKMLGKKTKDQEDAVLSQGSFATLIIDLISKDPSADELQLKRGETLSDDPSRPLRRYFLDGKDEIIHKILINYFTALKEVFPEEWNNPKANILWKTSGFGGVVKAFPTLFKRGKEIKNLSQSFFEECFRHFKQNLKKEGLTLTKDSFAGGGAGIHTRIRDLILDA